MFPFSNIDEGKNKIKNVFRPNYIQTYGELHHSPAKDNLQICLKDFDSMFNKGQDKTKRRTKNATSPMRRKGKKNVHTKKIQGEHQSEDDPRRRVTKKKSKL